MPDGSFTVSPPSTGEYRLWLDLADGCLVFYHSSGRVTLDRDQSTPIRIADNDVTGLHLQVPLELCSLRVAGRVEGIERFLDDTVHTPVNVDLCRVVGTRCSPRTSRPLDRDGLFTVAVPTTPGSYWLSYKLDACWLYHSPTGLTGNPAEAMRFDAGERDVWIGHRQVPDTMCAYQISGTIVGPDGAPLDTWTSIEACAQVINGNGDDVWALVGSDGHSLPRCQSTVPTDSPSTWTAARCGSARTA